MNKLPLAGDVFVCPVCGGSVEVKRDCKGDPAYVSFRCHGQEMVKPAPPPTGKSKTR